MPERETGAVFAQSNSPAMSLPNQIGNHIAQCWQTPRTEPSQIIEVTVGLSSREVEP